MNYRRGVAGGKKRLLGAGMERGKRGKEPKKGRENVPGDLGTEMFFSNQRDTSVATGGRFEGEGD